MIPVLGVPVLSRYDLVEKMFATVDVVAHQTVIIDNGGSWPPPTWVRLPANIGIAASWNLIIKTTATAPWWFLVNADIEFVPGNLAPLVKVMDDSSPKVVCMTLDGFAAFAINAACIEKVGWFDENFAPAYCEDADYQYRCKLAGVPVHAYSGGARHERSVEIADPIRAARNAVTYPANVAYYEAKWGGPMRGGERFDTPFDSGGGIDEWTLSFARVRDLRW